MAVSVTITTTPTQDAKLERVRVLRNGQGEAYVDVNDMAKQQLVRVLTAEVQHLDDLDAAAAETEYRDAFRNATPEVKAQIRALLGL